MREGDLWGFIDKSGSVVVEPQYDDMAAQTLASETGAKVYALDPVVTGPADPAEALTYYESAMRQNMQTLQEALGE